VQGTVIPAGSEVGVVGSSHSAVLVLKTLYELGNVSIVNFSGSPLLYAIYKDDWILYDNTGLKGSRQIGREKCWRLMIYLRGSAQADSRSEKEIYDAELKDCTHSVSAIGYEMNLSPRIHVDGREAEPTFYSLTGKFFWAKGSQGYLDDLFVLASHLRSA
jgi:hypothetical protein